MEVLLPISEVVVDFDIALVELSPNPHFSTAKVRSSISIGNADIDDLDTLSIERLQVVEGEILVLPDKVEEALVDMPRGSHGSLKIGYSSSLLLVFTFFARLPTFVGINSESEPKVPLYGIPLL
jgi:hypothetical protein